ncbi:Hypothetical predicted protein [Olea europaea subsp. europaea]|uniref:Uncharacterized protein n=1 Tax=Olea europaea subsp. europaea TaxID=158383 RepID=A0A8S0UJ82_OLEEU|nr:Hypothetical predicted protein [Olea europaea subsp. europaea]
MLLFTVDFLYSTVTLGIFMGAAEESGGGANPRAYAREREKIRGDGFVGSGNGSGLLDLVVAMVFVDGDSCRSGDWGVSVGSSGAFSGGGSVDGNSKLVVENGGEEMVEVVTSLAMVMRWRRFQFVSG